MGSQSNAAERTYREIFDQSSELIYIQDEEGTFLDVNQIVLDKYGYSRDEILGKKPDFLGVPGKNDVEKIQDYLKTTWEKGEPARFEWHGLKKDGTEFIKDVVVRKGHYFDRDVLIATSRDITERKKVEEELRRRNQELDKLNSTLDSFVYGASHDLKAPLSSIKGLLSLIKDADKEESVFYLDQIEISIDRLITFINDLIAYSRSSKSQISVEKVSIIAAVMSVLNELQFAEQSDGIEFEYDLNEPDVIFTDQFRFRVIVSNIIANAIRYRDHQKEKNYISIKSQKDDDYLVLKIIDNGIGIPNEDLERIFEMFYRSSNSKVDGSGIGLYLVNENVHRLGGKIQITSKLKVGTEVELRIPLKLHIDDNLA